MKINDILECFNKVLDYKGNPERAHYIAHSILDRKIGTVKSASAIITFYDPIKGPEEVCRAECTDSIASGHEGELIEQAQKEALIEFIKIWTDGKRIG